MPGSGIKRSTKREAVPPPEPRRWKDLPEGATGVEAEIAAATRLVRADPAPDEVRLVQLAACAVKELRARNRPPSGNLRLVGGLDGPARPTSDQDLALVLSSLLMGGIATAVSGRIIQRFQSSRRAAAVDAHDSTREE